MGYFQCNTGGADTSIVTATADDVLNGKVIVDADGNPLTGKIRNIGEYIGSVGIDDSCMIPAGYHNGKGKVLGPLSTNISSDCIHLGYYSTGNGKVTFKYPLDGGYNSDSDLRRIMLLVDPNEMNGVISWSCIWNMQRPSLCQIQATSNGASNGAWSVSSSSFFTFNVKYFVINFASALSYRCDSQCSIGVFVTRR